MLCNHSHNPLQSLAEYLILAYEILGDEESRRRYDRTGEAPTRKVNRVKKFDFNFEDIFNHETTSDGYKQHFDGNRFYHVKDSGSTQDFASFFGDSSRNEREQRLNKEFMQQKRILLENTRWFPDDGASATSKH